MKKRELEAIIDTEIVGWASDFFAHPVAVLGDEVYTMEEAKAAFLENADEDIEYRFGGEVDLWVQSMRDCIFEKEN